MQRQYCLQIWRTPLVSQSTATWSCSSGPVSRKTCSACVHMTATLYLSFTFQYIASLLQQSYKALLGFCLFTTTGRRCWRLALDPKSCKSYASSTSLDVHEDSPCLDAERTLDRCKSLQRTASYRLAQFGVLAGVETLMRACLACSTDAADGNGLYGLACKARQGNELQYFYSLCGISSLFGVAS
jgi:hypothetical protein